MNRFVLAITVMGGLVPACASPGGDAGPMLGVGTATAASSSPTLRSAKAELATTISASIQHPPGKLFALAGRADLAKTNAWLRARGEHFVAGAGADFPREYWGIDFQTDAYVFIDVAAYSDSTWTLAGTPVHRGAYAVADLTVYGFATDGRGNRIDVTGDGVVDDADWNGFEAQTLLSGQGPLDTVLLTGFEKLVFGANTSPTATSVVPTDAASFPNRASVRAIEGGLELAAAPNSANACSPDQAEWERCWYWDDHAGDAVTLYPAPRNLHQTWQTQYSGNNWVRFDPAVDTFRPRGDLADRLNAIGFEPLFWVRMQNWSSTYSSAAQ